jgi:hypothetical protein
MKPTDSARDCPPVEDLVQYLAEVVLGASPHEASDAMLAHLASCAACAVEAEAFALAVPWERGRDVAAQTDVADAVTRERMPEALWNRVRAARENAAPQPFAPARLRVRLTLTARSLRHALERAAQTGATAIELLGSQPFRLVPVDAPLRSGGTFAADRAEAARIVRDLPAEKAEDVGEVEVLLVARADRIRLTATRDGSPLAGVRIRVRGDSAADAETETRELVSDRTGTCVITGLPPGSYVLEAEI